jgi:hypothetical protein
MVSYCDLSNKTCSKSPQQKLQEKMITKAISRVTCDTLRHQRNWQIGSKLAKLGLLRIYEIHNIANFFSKICFNIILPLTSRLSKQTPPLTLSHHSLYTFIVSLMRATWTTTLIILDFTVVIWFTVASSLWSYPPCHFLLSLSLSPLVVLRSM